MDNARPFDLQEMEPKDKHLFEYNLDALVENERNHAEFIFASWGCVQVHVKYEFMYWDGKVAWRIFNSRILTEK